MEHADITGKIIGAAMNVHNVLGCGFQEVIYQRALAIELSDQDLSYAREAEMQIQYKGVEIGTRRVDFLVEGFILVELKALSKLERSHRAQIMNYCEAYNLPFGLLLNFGNQRLEFKRMYNLNRGKNK